MFLFASTPAVSPPIVHEAPISSYLKALPNKGAPGSLEAFFDRVFIEQIEASPQWISHLGFFEPLGLHEHNRHLDDLSIEAAKRELDLAKANWIQLQSFLPGDLSPKQELARQVVSWQLQLIISGEKFLYHSYPINQMRGVPQRLTNLFLSTHPLNNKEDVENYVVRLGQVEKHFKQLTQWMNEQRARGIFPPRFAIEKSISNLEKWVSIPVEKHPLYLRLADQSETIQNGAKKRLEKEVLPAYRTLISYLKENYQDNLQENGVWALPDGDAYYEYCLKVHTTLDITAEEIHEIGLQEVARIEKEIETKFKEAGLWQEDLSVSQHLQAIAKDPQYFYPNTDEGRQACLEKFGEILERSRKELGSLFVTCPKTPVAIKRVPPHEENGAPAAYYYGPSLDGSRPGMFFANLHDLRAVPTYEMETLTIHEAEPGHHFQIALVAESDAHLLLKQIFSAAHAEGWALYAEKLAYEQGFYSSPISQIGHLSDELFRAARLVVDTGIHWKKWSREEAIQYFADITGRHPLFVTSEVERYFVYPGQACSYKIGQLKILEARDREKKRLGDAFDLAKFHSDFLKKGVVPLSML